MNKRISVKISLEKHIEMVCELVIHAKELMMKGILTKLKSQAGKTLYRRGTARLRTQTCMELQSWTK